MYPHPSHQHGQRHSAEASPQREPSFSRPGQAGVYTLEDAHCFPYGKAPPGSVPSQLGPGGLHAPVVAHARTPGPFSHFEPSAPSAGFAARPALHPVGLYEARRGASQGSPGGAELQYPSAQKFPSLPVSQSVQCEAPPTPFSKSSQLVSRQPSGVASRSYDQGRALPPAGPYAPAHAGGASSLHMGHPTLQPSATGLYRREDGQDRGSSQLRDDATASRGLLPAAAYPRSEPSPVESELTAGESSERVVAQGPVGPQGPFLAGSPGAPVSAGGMGVPFARRPSQDHSQETSWGPGASAESRRSLSGGTASQVPGPSPVPVPTPGQDCVGQTGPQSLPASGALRLAAFAPSSRETEALPHKGTLSPSPMQPSAARRDPSPSVGRGPGPPQGPGLQSPLRAGDLAHTVGGQSGSEGLAGGAPQASSREGADLLHVPSLPRGTAYSNSPPGRPAAAPATAPPQDGASSSGPTFEGIEQTHLGPPLSPEVLTRLLHARRARLRRNPLLRYLEGSVSQPRSTKRMRPEARHGVGREAEAPSLSRPFEEALRGCSTPLNIDLYYDLAERPGPHSLSSSLKSSSPSPGDSACEGEAGREGGPGGFSATRSGGGEDAPALPAGDRNKNAGAPSAASAAAAAAAAAATKDDSLQWCHQQIQQVLLQHPEISASAAQSRNHRPLFHQSVLAEAAMSAHGGAGAASSPGSFASAHSPSESGAGWKRWRDVDVVPPPQQLEELLIVLAAAVKVHVAELMTLASAAEAAEFAARASRDGTDASRQSASSEDEERPRRVLCARHILAAAAQIPSLD
ncbi:hypothetical protein TGRUB_227980 [Toxoplasma gondii RUB]|uniref:Uncharacterized protein n=7 Tax=Toxoplasma gondii TaxID=5811 RepID=S7UXA9_TOXGG|nr:hypothetical protein TGGT1_227980 [Toxoplasma gondii GT1]KAF4640803.1 hypothetical protein TGRH88_047290 [Toxoplasma gondii]KFG45052.1 hypothetical protein TGDOM2_227980 [Toxoplasma gondii GAB2-2007-GAL-DOM2]KFG52092.1 hypothetical protein TGFOU_227980 [Toxoplasma gondii FOU]KFG65644.1 hypothetical protein TGRUB_227980 [Toxoplasma gondii RUB]PUA90990.1 hypothetical protein TGBR9_227980 [Toxoplasma gondii TgCATBr9]RQX74360.1 hypothetical protein TGCAST_227980 [Toxoplasma gondii CAST]